MSTTSHSSFRLPALSRPLIVNTTVRPLERRIFSIGPVAPNAIAGPFRRSLNVRVSGDLVRRTFGNGGIRDNIALKNALALACGSGFC